MKNKQNNSNYSSEKNNISALNEVMSKAIQGISLAKYDTSVLNETMSKAIQGISLAKYDTSVLNESMSKVIQGISLAKYDTSVLNETMSKAIQGISLAKYDTSVLNETMSKAIQGISLAKYDTSVLNESMSKVIQGISLAMYDISRSSDAIKGINSHYTENINRKLSNDKNITEYTSFFPESNKTLEFEISKIPTNVLSKEYKIFIYTLLYLLIGFCFISNTPYSIHYQFIGALSLEVYRFYKIDDK